MLFSIKIHIIVAHQLCKNPETQAKKKFKYVWAINENLARDYFTPLILKSKIHKIFLNLNSFDYFIRKTTFSAQALIITSKNIYKKEIFLNLNSLEYLIRKTNIQCSNTYSYLKKYLSKNIFESKLVFQLISFVHI